MTVAPARVEPGADRDDPAVAHQHVGAVETPAGAVSTVALRMMVGDPGCAWYVEEYGSPAATAPHA